MSKKNIDSIYNEMLTYYLNQNKVLRSLKKTYGITHTTVKYYDRLINTNIRYIYAIKKSKEYKNLIDNLENYLYT